MNLSEKIYLTLSQLDEWESKVFERSQSFLEDLFQYPNSELISVFFNSETVKCAFLVHTGATWTDSKPMSEFLKWVNNL